MKLAALLCALAALPALAETPAERAGRIAGEELAKHREPILGKFAGRHSVEFSFGASQLFATLTEPRVRTIPTPSALFLAEVFLWRRFAAVGLFNLPLGTQKVYANGKLEETYSPPVAALGLRGNPMEVEVLSHSRLEVQLALLAARTFGSLDGDTLFPLSAIRFHLARESGFSMYLGASWAFQKQTFALIYGVGNRF